MSWSISTFDITNIIKNEEVVETYNHGVKMIPTAPVDALFALFEILPSSFFVFFSEFGEKNVFFIL